MAKKKVVSNENNIDTRFPNTELARLWRIPFSDETEPSKVEDALRERIKELNCLYGVSMLAERHFNSLGNMLEELVNFLPYSWQYPDITCVRIVFKENTYKSERFKVTEYVRLPGFMFTASQ